jgi:hypothetical protein
MWIQIRNTAGEQTEGILTGGKRAEVACWYAGVVSWRRAGGMSRRTASRGKTNRRKVSKNRLEADKQELRVGGKRAGGMSSRTASRRKSNRRKVSISKVISEGNRTGGNQCCGSRILIFTHPGSRIQNSNKRER